MHYLDESRAYKEAAPEFELFGGVAVARQLPHKLMVHLIAYRAETALVHILREKIRAHRQDETRALARQIFHSDAHLISDPQAKTLTVEIHGLSTPRDNAALEHLCAELTATDTQYTETDLRLIYRKVTVRLPPSGRAAAGWIHCGVLLVSRRFSMDRGEFLNPVDRPFRRLGKRVGEIIAEVEAKSPVGFDDRGDRRHFRIPPSPRLGKKTTQWPPSPIPGAKRRDVFLLGRDE